LAEHTGAGTSSKSEADVVTQASTGEKKAALQVLLGGLQELRDDEIESEAVLVLISRLQTISC